MTWQGPLDQIGAAARWEWFWLRDRVRGGPIRRHFDDIGAEVSRDRNAEEKLHALLAHASATTPFYEPYADCDLDGFPVIDKARIKLEGDHMRSRAYDGMELHRRRTSGSTGTPLVIDQDPHKRQRTIADVIYFNRLAGLRLGDRLMWFYSARLMPMSRWQRRYRNIIPVDHSGMSEDRKALVVDTLRDSRVRAIVAIPSVLDALARFMERRGDRPGDFSVTSIISIGELLLPDTRARIAAAFGCDVAERYSNEENGVLAGGTPGGRHLLLNRASYHFEFLRPDRDEPQGPGGLARVVITDLYNRATPMIRYDTGDLAVVGESDERGVPATLARIEGREVDAIFDTSGGRIPSLGVSQIMVRSFPLVDGYRLVQDAQTHYELTIAPGRAEYPAADFVAVLRRWLGADATIAVEFVAAIPPLASGKHRPVIGRYRPPRQSPVEKS